MILAPTDAPLVNFVVRDGLTTTHMLMGSECGDLSFVALIGGR
jgi:hypothetical protein